MGRGGVKRERGGKDERGEERGGINHRERRQRGRKARGCEESGQTARSHSVSETRKGRHRLKTSMGMKRERESAGGRGGRRGREEGVGRRHQLCPRQVEWTWLKSMEGEGEKEGEKSYK